MTSNPPPPPTTRDVGARGEDLAAASLELAGLTVIDRNWRCREGEIDLVALDPSGGPALVFVEVKLRRGRGYGDPLEAITVAKARRLRRLAGAWLAAHPEARTPAVRLDAVGVLAEPGREPVVRHTRGIES